MEEKKFFKRNFLSEFYEEEVKINKEEYKEIVMSNYNKMLIIIDMQNDFVTGSLGSEAAQAIVPAVVNKIRNWRGDIVFTRDTHYDAYLTTLEGEKLPIKHCIKNTSGWEIIPEIREYAKFADIIDKRSFGYHNWNAEDILFNYGVSEIEIIGLCTDICVISNALSLRALYPNTKITVDARCCAGTTKEAHDAALLVMKSCQIDIIGE